MFENINFFVNFVIAKHAASHVDNVQDSENVIEKPEKLKSLEIKNVIFSIIRFSHGISDPRAQLRGHILAG